MELMTREDASRLFLEGKKCTEIFDMIFAQIDVLKGDPIVVGKTRVDVTNSILTAFGIDVSKDLIERVEITLTADNFPLIKIHRYCREPTDISISEFELKPKVDENAES